MKLKNNILKEEKNNYSRLHTYLGVKHQPSSNNKYNTMTKKFLNNYSFAKNDMIDGAYIIPNSKIKISDIIQPIKIKNTLNSIIDEYRNKELLESFGLLPNNKLIFNGPSGCGKTLYALAMANYLKKTIYIVNLSSIISSSLGKTSNNIFEVVEKCNFDNGIIFFDEFDALAKIRNDDKDHGELKRIASSLIQILDFINDDLILIAATNHIDLIDKAIIRRFSKRIDFEMPTKTYIKKYILKTLKELDMLMDNDLISNLSEKYKGKSYAEIKEDLMFIIKKYIIEQSKKGQFEGNISNEILKY